MVCRIQESGEHCSRLLTIKLCRKILQGVFNLHVGGCEGTVHSRRLKHVYPLQFSDIYLGKKAAHCDWTALDAASWGIIVSKGTEFCEPCHCIFPKGFSFTFLFRACNTMDCPTSVTAFCFALIFPEMTP